MKLTEPIQKAGPTKKNLLIKERPCSSLKVTDNKLLQVISLALPIKDRNHKLALEVLLRNSDRD